MSEPDNMDGNLVKVLEWLRWLLPRDDYGAVIGIDFVHHEIHEGNHYTVAVYDDDVDNAAPKKIRVTTPDTSVRAHFIFEVSADDEFLIQFYEDPTLLAAGAGLTEVNNDRNSGNTADVTTFEDTTTQAPNNDGTLLFTAYSGGEKKKAAAEAGSRLEWILKQNEDYIIKITATNDNTAVNIDLAWYEES